jgi:replicative DNA helicase
VEFAVVKHSLCSECPDLSVIPVNLPAEREVLGSLVEDGGILSAALASGLCVDDFSLSDHRRVFEAILQLKTDECPVDYITVTDRLGNSDNDFVLLASLINGTVIVRSHVLHHLKILRKNARLRALAILAEWILESVNQVSADPDSIAQAIRARLGAK